MGTVDRTVTLKARVDDPEAIESSLFEYTESLGRVSFQEDVYFNVPHGHMKLRITRPNRFGQLIYYKRPAGFASRLSETRFTEVDDVASLKQTLSTALGELGVVRMRRRIFEKGNVRIHLDFVDDIGLFIDITVYLNGSETEEVALKKAKEVQKALGIHDSQVIPPCAYVDLLLHGFSTDTDDDSVVHVGSDVSSLTGIPKAANGLFVEQRSVSISSDSDSTN